MSNYSRARPDLVSLRLFLLSATGTDPTSAEALALFYMVAGAKADVAGYMRLPEFKRVRLT